MISPGLRDSLRLAATVTAVNGFTQITGLPFAYYASLAVLSVTVGNYGNTLELGRQRLIGTAVGAVVVFFGYRAWGQLPVVVALPLALLLARLIAGALRLSVGCFVVVMGWLSHEQQLGSWIPMRLIWTAFGILMALLSLRLFWPSRARIQQSEGLLELLVDLGQSLEAAGDGQARATQSLSRAANSWASRPATCAPRCCACATNARVLCWSSVRWPPSIPTPGCGSCSTRPVKL